MESLLFFSGGSAPRKLARLLSRFSINSTHIISTFDSGRSSRELRRIFAMPAIGDLRNRLLALADIKHTPEAVLEFLHFRLPDSGNPHKMRQSLTALGSWENSIWDLLPEPEKNEIFSCLRSFLDKMPSSFDPRNASMGNLVLTGAYFKAGKKLADALTNFGRLIQIKGIVLPICEENLNLAAKLEDGSILFGQHEFKNVQGKIKNFYLSVHEPYALHLPDGIACHPPLFEEAAAKIRTAAAICFPMGSFFSSILANTLVKGVGKNIAQNSGVKIFIPNSGYDPENTYLDIAEQVSLLLKNLKNDSEHLHATDLLNYVLLDRKNGAYPGGIGKRQLAKLASLGIEPIFYPIVKKDFPSEHLPLPLLSILLKLAAR